MNLRPAFAPRWNWAGQPGLRPVGMPGSDPRTWSPYPLTPIRPIGSDPRTWSPYPLTPTRPIGSDPRTWSPYPLTPTRPIGSDPRTWSPYPWYPNYWSSYYPNSLYNVAAASNPYIGYANVASTYTTRALASYNPYYNSPMFNPYSYYNPYAATNYAVTLYNPYAAGYNPYIYTPGTTLYNPYAATTASSGVNLYTTGY